MYKLMSMEQLCSNDRGTCRARRKDRTIRELGLKPDLRGEKPMTNSRGRGMVR
jgi:hypothetical protein